MEVSRFIENELYFILYFVHVRYLKLNFFILQ